MIDQKGKVIKIENLCCANCGRELEEALNAISGVSASVDVINLQVFLTASTQEAYDSAIYEITHFEDVRIVDGTQKEKGLLRQHLADIVCTCAAIILFVLALTFEYAFDGVAFDVAAYVLYSVAYIAVGYGVLIETAKNIVKGKIFDENFLMTVASLGAIALGIWANEGFMEGVAVMLLYRIGELLQAFAVGASRKSIKGLLSLKSDTATVIIGDETVIVAPEDLCEGDLVLIKAGEKVPVDCVVFEGSASFDVKSLTGESMPKEAVSGDEVLSGSINLSGAIKLKVIRKYQDSTVAKILQLVENTAANKSKSEKFITKFARYYTPIVVSAAALVAALVPTIICLFGGVFTWDVYADWIYRSLSFLVISCPCALVISVPLSYFCGMGKCAKIGVLVKSSTTIDELSACNRVLFDKTGTLTEGKFKVSGYSSEYALYLCVAGEKLSSHPIAKAFDGLKSPCVAESVIEVSGKGLNCVLNGKKLLLGNEDFLAENGVCVKTHVTCERLIYVGYDGEYAGWVAVDDEIKGNANYTVDELKKLGVKDCYMLTGDDYNRAEKVAKTVGLDGFYARLLPDEKVATAKKLKDGEKIIYVGDGVNDAPVMTLADCAVSVGKTASDVAIEASDVVLVGSDLSLLPQARKVAKKTTAIVWQNIIGSIFIKLAVMVLGVALPSFPLLCAIFADVGVMLLAVLNATRVSFGKR